jgi:hypothetical protein
MQGNRRRPQRLTGEYYESWIHLVSCNGELRHKVRLGCALAACAKRAILASISSAVFTHTHGLPVSLCASMNS